MKRKKGKKKEKKWKKRAEGRGEKGEEEENEVEPERRAIFDSSAESKTFAIQKNDGKGRKGDEKKENDLNQCARKYREEREREREREKKRERSNRRKLPFRDVRAVNVIRMVVNSPLWTRRTAKFFNGKPFRTCYRLARSPYLEPDTSTGARIFPFTVEIFAEKEKERKKEKILASVCIKNTSFCLNWGWSLPRNLQLVRKVLGFLSTYWKFQPLSTVVSWP